MGGCLAAQLHLDTHAVVWLHQGDLSVFSSRAQRALEKSALLYAPALLLELQFLFEIGRIVAQPNTILSDLYREIDLQVCSQPYLDVMQAACLESWTRDPFDRAIVAQARRSECPLLTRDRKILDHYPKTFS